MIVKVKSNLDVIIYEHILDALILGEYKMGQMILLDELTDRYEVSRTPVTQAVRLMANDGLLEVMNNGRVKVPVFNDEQIKKICEVRFLLESFAVDENLKKNDNFDGLYGEMINIAEKGQRALDMGDKLKFNKYDLAFHKTLIDGASNEFLTDSYKRVQGKFIVANYLILPLQERSFEKAANSHLEIAEKLKARDAEACKDMLKQHIFSYSTPF